MNAAQYPVMRARRLRQNEGIRALVRETILTTHDLIQPLFILPGKGIRNPIQSMPGQFQFSIDEVVKEAENISRLGIPAVLLFGLPDHKDATGSDNFNPDGIIPKAIRAIKEKLPDLIIISDLCFCEYTDHGHCGIINTPGCGSYNPYLPDGYLLNEASLEVLGQATIVHAQAGADIIAPSGMLDGMVGAIRAALDHHRLQHVSILSYAAKYSSSFYGPFREAAESSPSFGNRKQYQLDPANRREALKEIELDVAEGADMLMVKPALPYLDILRDVHQMVNLPLAAYQVSGEYAMIHAAAQRGWLDLQGSVFESLIAIKRAGADMIITYFASDVARWLNK